MISFLSILIPFFLLACSSSNGYVDDGYITIVLLEGEHYHSITNNIVKVKRGDDVSWEVELEDGYCYKDSLDGSYEGDDEKGVFTIKNVQTPKNVSFNTQWMGGYRISIYNDETLGSLKINPSRKVYKKDELVTIEITPHSGVEFMCFTNDYPYRNPNIYDPSGRPCSFSTTYSFAVNSDVCLYTNYLSDDLLKISYVANGGKTIDGDDVITLDYTIPEPFTKPSTMLGSHYLIREGYTLTSYNTKQDGSGTSIGIGSSVDTSFGVDNTITLYAQWKKWNDASDFVTSSEDDGCHITEYVGDSDASIIVVPDCIDGKKVTSIGSNVFDKINVKTIVLNESLSSLRENAINECEELVDLYLFTNVKDIDVSSVVSSSLTNLHIISTLYSYDRPIRNKDIVGQVQALESMENRVVIFGPSTFRYNHPVSLLEDEWSNKSFFLAGMQAGGNHRIAFDIVANILNNDDYLFIGLLETCLDPDSGGMFTFSYLKFDFDLLLRVNYQNYKTFLLRDFRSYVNDMITNESSGIYLNQTFKGYDKYGMVEWSSVPTGTDNVDPSYVIQVDQYMEAKNFTYFNEIIDNSNVSPSKVRLLWSTYNVNSIQPGDIEKLLAYEQFALEQLPYEELEPITSNVMEGWQFRIYDSTHLSIYGGINRVNRWKYVISNSHLFDE